jgi:hypothetical protein
LIIRQNSKMSSKILHKVKDTQLLNLRLKLLINFKIYQGEKHKKGISDKESDSDVDSQSSATCLLVISILILIINA